MVLIEEYFELYEADDVSKFWKAGQLLTYVCAAGFGIWCGFTIALLRKTFKNKCFLFGKILSDTDVSSAVNELQFVEPEYSYEDSMWSHDAICEYCQYSMVSSFMFSTIWATFFLMCGKGGKSAAGLPQPWRIALPALVFNFIYFLITFVAALQIQQGTDVFCNKKAEKFVLNGPFRRCSVLRVYEKRKAEDILIRLEIAIKTSWLAAISWFVAFLIPLFRIIFVSDFYLHKICVYKLDDFNDETEEIMTVTDYEESKHVRFEPPVKENHPHED